MNRDIFRDIAQFVMGIVLLAGCFYFLHELFFSGHAIPPELKDSATLVTGTILTLIGGIAGYFFGSSQSSARKDSVIAKGTP